jgi:hypothetical protein
MALQTLSIDLEANVARFTADMGKAARATERTSDQISKGLNAIKATAGGLVAGLSVGFFVQLTKSAIDSIDALNDVRDATGASIENLSALEDIAARTGTRFEVVGDTLAKFNKTLNDAKPGSEIAKSLEAIGLSVEKLKQQDPAEALRTTANALAGYADDGKKARLETVLFGEQVKNVAPFLKNLGDAGALVAKVTTAQAEEAEKFNRELLAMQKNVQDVTRSLASDFVTGVNKAAAAVRESGLWAGLGAFLTGDDQYKSDKALVEQTDQLLQAERELARSRQQDAQFGDKSLRTAAAEKRVAQLKEEIKLTQSYRTLLAEVPKSIAAPLPSVKTVPPTVPKVKEKAGSEPADTTQRALDQYVETLQKAIEREQDLTEVQRAQLRIAETGARGFSEAKREYVLGLAERVDATREAAEMEKFFTAARLRTIQISDAYIASLSADNDALVRSNDTLRQQLEELGLNADAVDRLRLARLDAALAAERENLVNAKNIEGNEAEIQQIERRIRLKEIERGLVSQTTERRRTVDLEKESADAANVLNADVKTALSNAFRDSQSPIQSFGAALGNVVYTRLTNATATGLADILVGSGKPGSSGGLFSGAIKGLSSFFGGFFADGGNPPVGKASIVGERGPEWFIPRQAGTIVPAGKMRGGGFTASTTINIQGGGNTAEIYSNVSKALEARDRAWSEQLTQAGVLA